jgi:hypothetical protein
MDFMGMSLCALAENGVSYHNLFGVYWAQTLSNGIQDCLRDGYDYIITTDYDAVYNGKTVKLLIDMMEDCAEIDAITTLQQGRCDIKSLFTGSLFYHCGKEADLVPIDTGHFGLTIFRASAFEGLKKPWFNAIPDENGEWSRNSPSKLDADIYFWKNFIECGKKLYIAPRAVVGHLELLVKWPDEDLNDTFQTLEHYREHGKPDDAWK